MKGYGIYVKNDLLELKHFQNMGVSVWLYMWLLDKMTSINENGIGKVLGGKPITSEELCEQFGISEKTYRRWVDNLQDSGYISTIRAPHGMIFTVNKASKIFGKRSDNSVQRSDKFVSRSDKNDRSIYRQYKDNTKTIDFINEKEDNRGKESPAKEALRLKWSKQKLKVS